MRTPDQTFGVTDRLRRPTPQTPPRRHPVRAALTLCLLTATCALSAGGCGGGTLVLVPSNYVDSSKLDGDPVSILPPGILMFGYIDAATMFRSSLAPDIAQLVQTLLPLGPE